MPRSLAALAALLIVAALLSHHLIESTAWTRSSRMAISSLNRTARRSGVSSKITYESASNSARSASRGGSALGAARISTTTRVDLHALAPLVDFLRAVALSEQSEQSRRLNLATHVRTVPSFSTSNTGCAYAGLIRSIWQRDAEWAIGIAWRESRCIPTARNSSGASGLFQLMLPLHADLFDGPWSDPAANIRAAWRLYQGAGRAPWAL